MKKGISILLVLSIILSLGTGFPMEASASGATPFTATAQGEYTVKAEAQYITILIELPGITAPYTGFGIDDGITEMPDGFQLVSYSTSNTSKPLVLGSDYFVETGLLSYQSTSNKNDIPAETTYTAVFSAPANASGDFEIVFGLPCVTDQSGEYVAEMEELSVSFTISDAPAAAYSIYYTLNGVDADGDSYNDYEAGTQVAANLFLVSNNADVTVQAYDIYLDYSDLLSFNSEAMAGTALTASSNTQAAAGATVTHIQLVANQSPIELQKGVPASLGTITFDIKSNAQYADELYINLTTGEGASSTNIAIGSDKTAYYPVNTGSVSGAEVMTTYTVTYVDGVDDEEITVPAAQVKEYNKTLTLSDTTPTREGYTFAGWQGSDGETYIAEGAYATNADLTLTAQWTRDAYTIIFQNEDGTVLQSGEVNVGEMPVYSGETPTKAATAQYTYTFAGWTPAITAVTGEQTYTATYDATLNEYTITFENEDGTELQSSKVAYGETPTYTGATPTKDATAQYTYTFKKWSPEITAVTEDKTYTATYTEAVNKYTVTFATEYGTAPEKQTIAYGSKATNPGVLTVDHYDFGGWYTDDTYATAYDFEKQTITEDTTIYAKWTPKTYTVTFNANGGSGEMAAQTFTYGVSQALTANDFTAPTGKTFNGWNTEAAGTGTSYTNSQSISLTGNITLYAQWSANDYTVSADSKVTNGFVSVDKASANYGNTITVTVTPAEGYEIDTVTYTPENGTAFTITPVDGEYTFTMPAANVTVSATFTAIDYTVAVDANISNGSVKADKTAQAHVGETITLTATPATGYKLTAYTVKDASNNSVTVTNGKFVMPASNVTVTAEFEPISYSIKFDGNGADSGSMNIIEGILYGNDQALTKNDFARKGYKFLGWSTDKNANDKDYADEATVNSLSSTDGETITLYAIWDEDTFFVTLNTNGGTINSGDVPVYIFGTGATLPTDITKTGYEFVGWYDNANCTGNPVTVIGTAEYGDKEYWAKWTASEYDIFYDENGGEQISDGTYTYGVGLNTLPTPTRPGYNFTGWYDGVTKVESITTTDIGDKTLTAKWNAITYTITFNANGGTSVDPMDYTIEDIENLPVATRANYIFAGWKLETATGGWAADTYSANTAVTGKWGDVTLVAQWTRAVTVVAEDYKYAASGYYMIRVADTLDPDMEYKFNGVSMYYIEDANYAVGGNNKVFYYLVEAQYVDTATGTLNDAGYNLLSTDTCTTRATITYNGDINGDGFVNIADANIVYQMIQNGGGYYTGDYSLSIYQRLAADMSRAVANATHRASIDDVNAIINLINGVN